MPTTSRMRTQLRFAAALSTSSSWERAVAEVCDQSLERLDAPVSLALVFVSFAHAPHLASIAEDICERIGSEDLLGCTGESIVGTGREIEAEPAISLWLASLPGSRITPMHLQYEQTGDGGTFTGWPDGLPEVWSADSGLLLLGEPFSFPADVLLARHNEDRRGVPAFGGMASGGLAPKENRLLLGPKVLDRGAVAVLVEGGTRIRTVVSQGCRPIGRTFVITKAEQNVIFELGGKPALAVLQRIFHELPTHEKELLQQGLHIGQVINEYQSEFQRGDFLVRNVIAADPENGSIAVGDYMRAGQTVQFHLRDRQTAHEDLDELLRAACENSSQPPAGALLFTCNGRGRRLFEEPDHDARLLAGHLGEIPTAGFFCQGEIGPIGGKNFLHGFTASTVLFEPVD